MSQFKELYEVDESIIATQKEDLAKAQVIIDNSKISDVAYENALATSAKLNKDLIVKVDKYQKRASRWPYWLGSGFIGGIVLCLLTK